MIPKDGDSFRFGDGYRISELCELVFGVLVLFSIILRCFRITVKLERKHLFNEILMYKCIALPKKWLYLASTFLHLLSRGCQTPL